VNVEERKRSRTDIIMSLLLLSLSLWYGAKAWAMPEMHFKQVIEASVYPLALAGGLFLLSLVLLFKGLRTKPGIPKSWLPSREILVQICFLFVALAAYIFMFKTLGYLTSTILFMIGTLRFIDRSRPVISVVLISLLVSGISYGLFALLFKMPMPPGILI